MKNSEFWEYADRLRSTNSRHDKRDIMAEAMQEYDVESQFVGLFIGDVFSPELSIGVGKKTVRKAIEKSYNVQKTTIQDAESKYGNLSETVFDLDRPNSLTDTREEFTVSETIDEVRDIAETSSETRKIAMMANRISESEHPHVFIYSVLHPKKDVALGVSWKTVRDACVKAFNVGKSRFERSYGSGYEVDVLVKRCKEGLNLSTTVYPGDRVRPMRASKSDPPYNDPDWVGQIKYDGGRLLIHRANGEIFAFTRQRHEISDNLPELQEVDWPNAEFVVDAEAVGYDPETGEVLPFQRFMERFQREKNVDEKAEEVEIKFRLFDLLYYNNDITKLDYRDRSHKLARNFPGSMVAKDYPSLEQAYEDGLEQGHEGIIAKKIDHMYEFQRSRNWRKKKPVKETVDLRVGNVLEGKGQNAGLLGSLELFTADGAYVGRVGTGFTDKNRKELWDMSLVGEIVEVEFEELQERGGDYGLRFPRFKGLRPDGEADTLERLESL
ncbi:MAG: hypothetical protein ABEH81_01180 [Halopenitus sp.]